MNRLDDRAIARLERQNAEFAMVADLLLTLGRTLDLTAIRREVMSVAQCLTGARRVRLTIRSGDGWQTWQLAEGREESGEWTPSAAAPRPVAEGQPLVLREDASSPAPGSYLGLPLCHQGVPFGSLEVEDLPVTTRLEDYLHTLSLVASAASLALENARAQEALAAERERLAVTLRSIGDGMIATDATGKVVLLNRVAEHLTGWTQEEAAGRPLADVFHIVNEKTRDLCESPVERVLQTGAIVGLANHTSLIARDGTERSIADSAAPIRDSQGDLLGVVLVFRDITEERQARRRIEELAQEAQRRAVDLDAVIGTVSHDLRNPLAVIQARAQLLLKALARAGLEGPERRNAEAILTGARQMNIMIQDMVDLARYEAGQLRLEQQPVSLATLVFDLVERTSGVLDAERVVIEVPPDLPPVSADPNRLERILVNLISNGLKYSALTTEVVVTAERRGDEVVVSVVDHGVGVPPEDRPRIFERFYRGKGSHKAEGVGLGLYGTRTLVEAHGGSIWFESEPGLGSTFSFTLPLA